MTLYWWSVDCVRSAPPWSSSCTRVSYKLNVTQTKPPKVSLSAFYFSAPGFCHVTLLPNTIFPHITDYVPGAYCSGEEENVCPSHLVSHLTIACTRTSGAQHSMLITTIRILACGLRRGWGYEAPHDGVIQLCFSRHDSGRNSNQPTNGRSQETSTYSVWWKVGQSFYLISLKGTSFQSAPARQMRKYFTTLVDTWALSGHPPHFTGTHGGNTPVATSTKGGWQKTFLRDLSKFRNDLTPPPSVQVRTRDLSETF